MDPFSKLTDFFMRFPGVGSRQAKRFVYHLLLQDKAQLERFTRLIHEVKTMMRQCAHCYRYFSVHDNNDTDICQTCRSLQTDLSLMMIVEKDVDVDSVLKSAVYTGRFFVFGGTIPLATKRVAPIVRMNELASEIERAAKEDGLKEIVFGFSANTEGEHTRDMIMQKIQSIVEHHRLSTTTLGRGLSTGTELEYSDDETLQSAFKNRFSSQ